ncbi:MAG: hypothetical protein GY832_32145 [Chloroflexi bacterium]|nr:hypothetical protein [Chloroflexota bacterium]
MNLRSHRHVTVESDGHGLGVADPSAAVEPEVTGPGADQNPLDAVAAGNQLPRVTGVLPQTSEVFGNDSNSAVA